MSQTNTDIWYMGTEHVFEKDFPRFESVLSCQESARARGFYFQEDRRDYTVAHALVRYGLARETGLSPKSLKLDTEPLGRPYWDNPAGTAPLSFSLSHTRGFVGIAITNGARVGIDLECVGQTGVSLELPMHVLSPAELDDMSDMSEEGMRLRFLQLWTLKEAYFKALGMGLQVPPGSVCFYVDSERVVLRQSNGLPSNWQFVTRFPEDRLCLSVCYIPTSNGVKFHDGWELFPRPHGSECS